MGFKFENRYKHKAFIDITPLIDLSFNLILFFMVSYSIGNISAITVHLPRAQQAGAYKSSDMIVTITEKNRVYINDKPFEESALLGEFRKRKEQVKDRMVVIRGDRMTNYETIVKVMDLLNQAGIPRFTLATIKSH